MKNLLEKQLIEIEKSDFIQGGLLCGDLNRRDVDDLLAYFSSKQTELLEEIRREIGGMKPQPNLDDYVKLVIKWNKTDFDVPFDHGYNQALADLLAKLEI